MSFPRYQPLSPLMSGEGSRAFLSLEISEDRVRPVVLVLGFDDIQKDEELAARVAIDTERASHLEHPNILQVIGLTQLEEGMARVVEFADAESLRRILDVCKTLPLRLAALIVGDAAVGVHYAHLAGGEAGTPLIHGDIRPETLMVTFSGVCKVSGYGAMAWAPKEMYGLRVKGRRFHCAPEQILGGRDAVNRQTDVYLLGLVLYESIAGNIPFGDEATFDDTVLNQPLPLLNGEEAILNTVIQKATAKKATDRYPTALAFRQAVEEAIGPLPLHQELANYLSSFFPADDPSRVVRRSALEKGMVEYGQPTILRSAASPSSSLAASTPAAVISHFPSSPPAVKSLAGSPNRIGFFFAGLLTGCVLTYGLIHTLHKDRPAQIIAAPVEVVALANIPLVSLTPDASSDVGSGAKILVGQTEVTDAGSASRPDAGPTPSALIAFSLEVVPAVEIYLDNVNEGSTPIHARIAPGKHTLRLVNKEEGISITRVIQIESGEPFSRTIVLGKGTLHIDAPEDATIEVDNVEQGKAPVEDISLYEGEHLVKVSLNTFRWQKPFKLATGQTLQFDVSFDEPDASGK